MDKQLQWELPLRHPPLLKQHPLRELQRLQGLPPLLELLTNREHMFHSDGIGQTSRKGGRRPKLGPTSRYLLCPQANVGAKRPGSVESHQPRGRWPHAAQQHQTTNWEHRFHSGGIGHGGATDE